MSSISDFYSLPVAQKIERLAKTDKLDKSTKVWILNLQHAVSRRNPSLVAYNSLLTQCYNQIVSEIDNQ